MAKGVKKIKLAPGSKYYPRLSNPLSKATIAPDADAWFTVSEWLPDTTTADKEKDVTWIWQEGNRKVILKQVPLPSRDKYKVSIPKKLCGPYLYYLEASLYGKRDYDNDTGLYVGGYCEQRIISSKWSTKHNGADVRKSFVFSYGQNVHLHLSTEGLNGDRLTIEIYNLTRILKDKQIYIYPNVEVIDGEINLEIKNTAAWMSLVKNIQNEEQFYIKVKNTQGRYIVDNNNDTAHARFLRIKKELISARIEEPENHTPAVVNQPTPDPTRYDPCKFDKISITEIIDKDGSVSPQTIVIFDKGTQLISVTHKPEYITRTVYFEFDSYAITGEMKSKLEHILSFLLNHEGSAIVFSGFACVIGKQTYNKKLSQNRSDAILNFFKAGGLDVRRMTSQGYGEVNPSDDKNGRDNLKYKDEQSYIESRRVDISFTFNGHDAASILYEVIAPSESLKKDLTIEVDNFTTKECHREEDKHKEEIKITNVGQKIDNGDTTITRPNPTVYKVYANLSEFNLFPIQYIWPKATEPNKYWFHIHSCRYFSNKRNPTVKVNAYPDIKWTFKLFLNLTTDLSIGGQNLGGAKLNEFHKRTGKMGAEARWKQKETSFGFSLKGEWDKLPSGKYSRNNEFSLKYETKFKKLYDIFSSIGAITDGITSITGGIVRGEGMKKLPVTFAVKPPNIDFKAIWYLERAKINGKNTEIVGTYFELVFGAHPLIGLEITIDLLCAAIVGTASYFSGGTATKATLEIYNKIMSAINKGVKVGNDKIGVSVKGDIYIDLVVSSVIETDVGFSFNTENISESIKPKIEAKMKLKAEIKAGAYIKGEIILLIITAEGYFEAKVSGSASITFGHSIINDTNKAGDAKGLYYKPMLGFDGMVVEYLVAGKVGLSYKTQAPRIDDPSSETKKDDIKVSDGNEKIFAEGTHILIPKFDVIEALAALFDTKIQVPIIQYNKNDKDEQN